MRNTNLIRAWAALIVLAGCGGEKSGSTITAPTSDVATVSLTPNTITIGTGKTTTLQAVALNAAGTSLSGRTFAWSSINPSIATVSNAGVVTGLTAGVALISVTSEGKSGLATVTVTPTLTTTGAVYMRDENVAYLADYFPTTGIANAKLTLSVETAMSASNGAFTLQAGIAPTGNSVPLNATMSGVQATWYPWLYGEASKPIAMGLYPETPVTPRPGFVKGVVFHDGAAWGVDWFNAGMTGPTIDRMRDLVGANLAVFPDQLTAKQLDIPSNTVVITLEEGGLGTRAQYATMVSQARAKGMQFMTIISITYTTTAVANAWPGLFNVPTSNTAFWDAFFKAYTAPLLNQVAIARDLGIEYVGIGGSLDFLFRLEPARWQALIAAVRATGYTGKLVYVGSANTTANFIPMESMDPATLGLFDVILVVVNSGVLPAFKGEVLGKEYSRARMRADARTIVQRVNAKLIATPKPVWFVIATYSIHGAISTSEYLDVGTSCEICNNNPINQRTRDYYQHADLYQAWAEAINGLPANQVSGLISWGYNWTDDFYRGGNFTKAGEAHFDKSPNVRGKPAEAVLSYWFKRW